MNFDEILKNKINEVEERPHQSKKVKEAIINTLESLRRKIRK